MSVDLEAACVAAVPSDTVAADERRAAAALPVTEPRAARADGRSRRFRFGDALDDAPPRAVTGSIAISFAVVSRRNWPR
ncbi:hypothetical protein KDW55_04180 [Burkholderia sp. AU19243]|nr:MULTISPECIES: hypothetical protein [Burkholderia]AIO39776.1 hypothetical protein DM40_4573 [Burkholderia cenocepacia]MBR7959872.1 hypothetical protein [Burkholderia vietnamiensis]AOK07782.1 hypothetical protein WK25_25305 [Burkholderia latens]MBR8144412.1 hypothetical protein [Burkholderia vietnamiensis]MBR8362518.1 hypothetical protein [Burkholderia sp. AU19243]